MDWIALLGALGVGALVSTWVSNSRERRQARSRARGAIANVEHLRWAPQDPGARAEQAQELWQARRDPAVAAMIAGPPRGITEEYIRLAAASWQATSNHWDSHGAPTPRRGWLPPPVAGDAAGREDAAPFGRGGVEVGGGHGAGGIDDGCDGDAGSAQGGAGDAGYAAAWWATVSGVGP